MELRAREIGAAVEEMGKATGMPVKVREAIMYAIDRTPKDAFCPPKE